MNFEYWINALHNEDWTVQVKAVRTLGELGDPRAIPDLIEAMYDTHITSVSTIAASALEEIGTPEAIVAVQQWRQNLKS